LVFSNLAGGPMGHTEPEHALARECDRLSLPRLTPHGLRHLCASLLLDRGLPLPAVSARLGHANPNITAAIYSHAIRGQDRLAAEALERAVERL
jgi:integrase